MFKDIKEANLQDKTVLLRVDYNVPIQNNKILDDTKIKASLKTISYLLENNCRIIILSHLGKIKSDKDKEKYSLEIVAKRLNELVNTQVIFSRYTRSPELDLKVKTLNPKEILVLENTRFEDYPNKLESNCDLELAEYWASLGDLFVMDAFATSHRRHASTYGIAKFIPSYLGFLVLEEEAMLNKYVLHPEGIFTIIVGGSKIDDKLELMQKLLPKCNYMLVTGGLANSCLKALGLNVGTSLATDDEEILQSIKEMLITYKNKISLPLDVIISKSYAEKNVEVKNVNELDYEDYIGDIGPKTMRKYKGIIYGSDVIFLNGTCGIYEDKRFSNGTLELLEVLKESNKKVICGGGDALSAVKKFNHENDYTYLSTGGGATLDYIINEKMAIID